VRVLLLSAYAAGSHQQWRRQLQAMMDDWDWRVLEMPPRYFSWRVRGNPLYWSQQQRQELECQPGLVLATSMVDLATLRGLVPSLASVPSVLYFHENQFDYPQGRGQHGHLEAQMVSLYSALAADQLWFNSDYNRRTFLAGVQVLLKKMPDKVPAGVSEGLASKASVMPVPVDVPAIVPAPSLWSASVDSLPDRPLRLLWLGRFEYDKGADTLLQALQLIESSGLDYALSVVGQQFRQSPEEFAHIEQRYAHRLRQFGYMDSKADYWSLLRGADIVISTSRHEFQGLAILEAVMLGCVPLLPDRMAYSEIFPSAYLYSGDLNDSGAEAESLVAALMKNLVEVSSGRLKAPDAGSFRPRILAGRYRRELAKLAASGA
jgi:glycosyltransferase involved in cell wall biosynthesis